MRAWKVWGIGLLLGATGAATGMTVPGERMEGEARVQISGDIWISRGASEWEVSFFDWDDFLGEGTGRSLLKWEDLDSIVYRLAGVYRVNDWLALEAAFGFGTIDDGRNTDTDWLTTARVNNFVYSQSIADTDGDLSLFELTAAFRLNRLMNMSRIGGEWDFLFGYSYYEESVGDRNGIQTIEYGQPVYESFSDLDSTFDFQWRMFRLGLRGETEVGDKWRLRGQFAALLGIAYEGEGFWNLRDDFRAESPNFVQEASGGVGFDLAASLAYQFTPRFYAELGYRLLSLRVRDGSDYIYFADGGQGYSDLDDVRSTRHGAFIGVGAAF
jgi:hypothetical protein